MFPLLYKELKEYASTSVQQMTSNCKDVTDALKPAETADRSMRYLVEHRFYKASQWRYAAVRRTGACFMLQANFVKIGWRHAVLS